MRANSIRLLVVAVFSSCSSSHDRPPPAGTVRSDASIVASDAARRDAGASVTNWFAFASAENAASTELWFGCSTFYRVWCGSVSTCIEETEANRWTVQFRLAVSEAIERGTVRFDDIAAETCIAGYSEAAKECDAPDTCADVLVGTVPEGGQCFVRAECLSGMRCDLSDSCPGRCALYVAPGSPCSSDEACAPGDRGAWCEDGVCWQFVSGEMLGPGEECGGMPGEGDDHVVRQGECVSGYGCNPNDGICVPDAPGAPCENNGDCLFAYSCREGRCELLDYSRPLGAECDAYWACDISDRLECDAEMAVCVPMEGDGQVGDECDSDQQCLEGLYCLSGVCAEPRASGESCYQDLGCQSAHCQITNYEDDEGTCSDAFCSDW